MIKLSGLAAELFAEIAQIPVIDCHEHLPTEAERVAQKVDVTTLFTHYTRADLECAGLANIDIGWEQHEVFDTSRPLLPRWRKLKPHLRAIRHGSYAYPALAYVRDVLGFADIDDSTVEAISERLQADNRPGIYKRIMQERCGIEKAIQCKEAGVEQGDQPFFVYLVREQAWKLFDAESLSDLEALSGCSIHSLAECVEALRRYLSAQREMGAVGMKVGCAYHRSLDIAEVSASEAERVFARLRGPGAPPLSAAERVVLSDYLIRREVEQCIDLDMPVVIHTGYQAGVRNDIRNARATELWPLLRSYPQARFDLFHGSFPYVEDMTVLGKYFPNVSLNMCWMHIMGPSISRRALDQWLDAVPATKIFAFGGDYRVVEKVCGHLELARADVAEVLAAKVERGRMSEADALEVARLLFSENPRRWYKLG